MDNESADVLEFHSASEFESDSDGDDYFIQLRGSNVTEFFTRTRELPAGISRVIIQGSQYVADIPVEALAANNFNHPRYPSFKLLQDRLRTFDTWPIQLRQRPEELAAAGFYYSGKGDVTICHHCGIHIHLWEVEDDVIEQHLRWSEELKNTCRYIQVTKDLLGDREEPKTSIEHTVRKSDNKKQSKEVECSDYLCTVCLSNKLEVLYQPCRHIASCVSCALNLKDCPVCRTKIESFIHVFLP
jgi:baculoviral IAP repeat-containing protein 7/8